METRTLSFVSGSALRLHFPRRQHEMIANFKIQYHQDDSTFAILEEMLVFISLCFLCDANYLFFPNLSTGLETGGGRR